MTMSAPDSRPRDPEILARENEDLRTKLKDLTREAAYNETILRRTQERELSLLRADGLAPLLRSMVDGLRESYALDMVTVALLDPQHEIRHLLIAGGERPEEFAQIFFVDSLIGLAPQFAVLHKPWLGPFVGADHHLLFPGMADLKSVALLPLPKPKFVSDPSVLVVVPRVIFSRSKACRMRRRSSRFAATPPLTRRPRAP